MRRTRVAAHPPPVNLSSTVKRLWGKSAFDSLKTKRVLFLPALAEARVYNRVTLQRDARAGLFAAMLALPQGLAFALIAGLPPEHGVYGAIAGMAAGALFSGARHVSIGPSATTA